MAEKSTVQVKFDEMVKESFVKILKPLGFKKQAYHFYLEQEGCGKVVNLQLNQYPSADEIGFTINLGLYFPESHSAKYGPNRIQPTFPKESDCSIRHQIGDLLKGQNTWFKIKNTTDVNVLIKQMTNLLEKNILPYFNKYTDKQAVFDNIASENQPDAAVVIFAENGYKEQAYQQYQLLVKEAKDPKSPYLLRLAKQYGFDQESAPGEKLKADDEVSASTHPLKSYIEKILAVYRDIVCPEWRLCTYDLRVEGSTVILENINGKKDRVAKGHLSAWMLLCAKYWTNTLNDEQYERFKRGDVAVEYYNKMRVSSISDCLVEAGLFFLKNKEEFEAKQCFWAAISFGEVAPSLMAKIPEPFRFKPKGVFDKDPILIELWKGRKSLTILAAAKTIPPFCKDKDPLRRWYGVDFFAGGLAAGGDPSLSWAITIQEIVNESILPLVNDKAGTVQYKALCAVDDWVEHAINRHAKEDSFFFAPLLLCIEALLENGFHSWRNLRYKWECLVGCERYDEAEKLWPLFETVTKDKSIGKFKVAADFFNTGDLIDWRITALSHVANALLAQKKITPGQLVYIERLLDEALSLGESRLAEDLKNHEKLKGSRGFRAWPYARLGGLREKQSRFAEALAAYERAKEIETILGNDWRKNVYDKNIAELKNKVK